MLRPNVAGPSKRITYPLLLDNFIRNFLLPIDTLLQSRVKFFVKNNAQTNSKPKQTCRCALNTTMKFALIDD